LDQHRWSEIHLINLSHQDLNESLSDIDRCFGLPVSFESDVLKEQSHQDERRYQTHAGSMKSKANDTFWTLLLSRSAVADWPDPSELAVTEAVQRIRRLYQRDYLMIEALKKQSVQPARSSA